MELLTIHWTYSKRSDKFPLVEMIDGCHEADIGKNRVMGCGGLLMEADEYMRMVVTEAG